ncbi:F0F1 ATP synthase subunit B family protein [Roseomonas elaeocarpi]|uniref:ATP synthase subunit b n=1 Tax=Roseomonas elaeocarpi TaxID=907779 RepID=A0ABV6JVH3_9PROT
MMIRRKTTALAAALVLLPMLGFAQAPVHDPAPLPVAPSSAPLLDADRAKAIARTEAAAEDYAAAAQQAHDKGGMPQLDFNNPLTIAQVVWLLIIFGLFVLISYQWLLPPVGAVLTDRRKRISDDLEAARSAKSEADAAQAAHRAATQRSHAEAQAAITAAVNAANADAAAKAAVLNERLNSQIAAAEARIGQARDAAMGALREVATDAATSLVDRLVGIKDQAAVSAAVSRELAARGRA